MTVYLKKSSIFALFLMAANSANADLVPKKLWEFDFKEKTGKDLGYISGWDGIHFCRTGSVLFVAYSEKGVNSYTF